MDNIFDIVVTVLSIAGSVWLLAGMIQMYLWDKKMNAAITSLEERVR